MSPTEKRHLAILLGNRQPALAAAIRADDAITAVTAATVRAGAASLTGDARAEYCRRMARYPWAASALLGLT